MRFWLKVLKGLNKLLKISADMPTPESITENLSKDTFFLTDFETFLHLRVSLSVDNFSLDDDLTFNGEFEWICE